MRTKAFHSFESKLNYFDDDVELIDVLRLHVIAGDLTDAQSNHVLHKVCTIKHKHLSRRQNSEGSRKLVINHLRSTLYSSYIKDVYEEVTEYLRTILKQAAEKGFDAGRLIGEHGFKINAKTVLEAGSWEHVAETITDSIFQALESERSTLELIDKIAKKLALNIDAELIEKALPFLEVRHLLVHSDGKASDEFKDKYPKVKLSNDYVVINYTFINNMRKAIRNLIEAYDQEVIRTDLVDEKYTQP
ncbi:hypothetical protein [Aeromonas salmonicida]|uniref:hypothetical protein n=1 Tax=Aeromonas salmonicida TaxID=645 RepID=UPI003D1970BD